MATHRNFPHLALNPDAHILIVGLGKSGFAAAKFFSRKNFKISVSDKNPLDRIHPEYLAWLEQKHISLEAGRHTTDLFTSVDCIVVSPGVPLDIPPLQAARRQAIPIVGEMAFATQFLRTPVVAITGTNGKTTVTTMLGDIFAHCGKKVFVGGNIGTPLFEYLDGPQEADIAVLEVSSFQLDIAGQPIGLRPRAALLLNITPDHLDRYPSFPAYADAKLRIFAGQEADDLAILNSDDPEIMKQQNAWPKSQRYFFSAREHRKLPGAFLQGESVILSAQVSPQEKKELYDLTGSAVSGQPNLQNSMAAILTARLLGCPHERILESLRKFAPLPHRMTLIAEIDGVKYIDDSKATNIGAVHASLTAMGQKILLIAGGRDKGGDYALLADIVQEKVKFLILIGEARAKMAEAFRMKTRVEPAESLEEAVYLASNAAEPGDVVLLSPACSSFDMFSSYSERGDVFARSVLAMRNTMQH